MRTIRCWRLRSMLTPYVDNELSAGERLRVQRHLERCERCRDRVSRERAVSQRLRRWLDETGADGVALSSVMTMTPPPHRAIGAMVGIGMAATVVIALVVAAWNRWPARAGTTFAARGLITDSRCAQGHTPVPGTLSRGDCVRRCIDMGAHYVFVSQGVIYAIRNPDFGGLPGLAGEEVQLEGNVQQNMLTISQVRPAAGHRSSNDFPPTKVRVS